MTPIKLRGRIFTKKDLILIKRIILKSNTKGITFISKIICEKLDWKQPSGWLKDRACREVLRELAKLKFINLPASKKNKKKKSSEKEKQDKLKFLIKRGMKYSLKVDKTTLTELNFNTLTSKQVKGTKDEDFWNWLVNKYHYLGFRLFVGRSLKYLIYSHDRIIAAIGFCDPVWSITPRDKIYKNCSKDEIRKKGINNGRYLILPWIKVPNLASHLLAVSTKKLYIDWTDYYIVKPDYVETFVNIKKFEGTCYKAANWKYMGVTKGYKKSGKLFMNSQPPKAVYIHFFNKELRKELENG